MLSETEELINDLMNLRARKERLQLDLDLLEEQDLLYGHGLYKPHYQFEKFIDYEEIREEQKEAIKEDFVIKCDYSIQPVLPDKFTKNIKKLAVRAFNSECDSFCAKVNYKNIVTFEQRMKKLREDLNKLIYFVGMEISDEYKNKGDAIAVRAGRKATGRGRTPAPDQRNNAG